MRLPQLVQPCLLFLTGCSASYQVRFWPVYAHLWLVLIGSLLRDVPQARLSLLMFFGSHEKVSVLFRTGTPDMVTDEGTDTAQILRSSRIELLLDNDIVKSRLLLYGANWWRWHYNTSAVQVFPWRLLPRKLLNLSFLHSCVWLWKISSWWCDFRRVWSRIFGWIDRSSSWNDGKHWLICCLTDIGVTSFLVVLFSSCCICSLALNRILLKLCLDISLLLWTHERLFQDNIEIIHWAWSAFSGVSW